MKLFLASEAKNEKTFPQIEKFVGGFTDKKVTYIPTAANGEINTYNWSEGGTFNLFKSKVENLKVLELEKHLSSEIKDVLSNSDILFVAGGASGYLLYWIRRHGIQEYLKDLLTQGLIYVGSSAGAMITAEDQEYSEWYIQEPEPGSSFIPGLDLVNFNFYPHFEDHLFPEIKEKYKGEKMYLVKNGEHITVVDGNVEVFGEERIVENS